MRRLELTGRQFGELKVLGLDQTPNKQKKTRWICRCSCGNILSIIGSCLTAGQERCIKCLGSTLVTHGFSKGTSTQRRFYDTWCGMIKRCYNKKHKSYHRYGGRGITVSRAWKKFENFQADMHESYIEHVDRHGEKYTTIERVDNDKGYAVTNCRWATQREQNRNNSQNHYLESSWGARYTLQDWADWLGIKPSVILNRMNIGGWSVDMALFTPLLNKGREDLD
jgi:hypothetical protein